MRKPTQLDQELKAWGDRVNRDLPPTEKQPPFVQPVLHQNTSKPSRSRQKPLFFGLGLSGLAFATLLVILWRGEHPTDLEPVPAHFTEQAATEFHTRIPYFQEVARLFQGHSVWISGDNAAMLLDVETAPEAKQSAQVVLRMEIQQQSEDGDWQAVWRRDVLAHENQWLEEPTHSLSRESVSIWIHSLSENTWFVESRLAIPALQGLDSHKQFTLTGGTSSSRDAHTELGSGLRMVHRLMPLRVAEWKDNV